MKNKFIQGYLIGKSVEILVAGTALLIAKKKGYLPSAAIPGDNRFLLHQ